MIKHNDPVTKLELNKKYRKAFDIIKASPHIPDGVKELILRQLKKQSKQA